MQEKMTNVTKVAFAKMLKYGLSPVIFAFTLIVALIVLNYVASVKTTGFDLTKAKVNTLTKETLNLLKEINYNIKIKAFYADSQQLAVKPLLDEYVKKNSRLSYQFIDPIKNPVVAEENGVKFPKTIVFESPNSVSMLKPPPRNSKHSERDITIALFRLSGNPTNTVYFTTGHGEYNIENLKRDGLSIAKESLIEQNYLIETVNLLEEGKVREDCTLLIVAGPKVPFTDEEAEMIFNYTESGGSVFFMIGPTIDANIDKVLQSNFIAFGDDYIYETSSKLTTQMGGPISPLCSAQDSSDITANLPNQNFLFPFVRSAYPNSYQEEVKQIRLLKSSESSWAESDLESVKAIATNQKPTRDEDEIKGPITIAMLTEREFLLPDSLATMNIDTYMVRSAFFGNASFITNEIATPFPSNINLFLNTVNWITRNENAIDITPHLYGFTPIELTPSERQLLSWLTLVIFPSSILIIGIIVWLRRR